MDYLCKILYRFNVSDFKKIASEYFEMSASALEDGIRRRKLAMNKKNLSLVLMVEVKKAKWNVNDVATTAFDLELEYVIKYSNRFIWDASEFLGDSSQGEISDLSDSIRGVIRRDKKDALVLVKKVDDFFWISVVLKNLKKIGIFEKPRYFALSTDGRYFFTKDNRCGPIIKYLTFALGYENEKKRKLSGKSLQSLLKLLHRKEKADLNNRPVYEGGTPIENELGLDFTQKTNYYDYFDKCVDHETDIDLQRYTVSAVNCPWMGDDNPALSNIEFKSSITLSGNVARIIRQLPVASIVRPPLPNYLKNFSVTGRNFVSVKPSLPEMKQLSYLKF